MKKENNNAGAAGQKPKPKKKKIARKQKDPHETLSKWWFIGALAVGLIAAGVVLASFLLGSRARAFRYDEASGSFTNEATGTVYQKATGWRAYNDTEKKDPYGKAGDRMLFTVSYKTSFGYWEELDPAMYLQDASGQLYIPAALQMPSLDSFKCDAIQLVDADRSNISYATLNEEGAASLVEEYLQKRFYSLYGDDGLPQHTFVLLLESKAYPVRYVLYLVRHDNGELSVYSDEDRTGMKISDDFFKDFFQGDSFKELFDDYDTEQGS